MRIRSKTLIAGAALAAASIAGAGIAFSQSGEPAAGGAEQEDSAPDVPITGPELQQATDAALAHLGQGRVTETEKGDEESLYEVEEPRHLQIRRADQVLQHANDGAVGCGD